jgi:hypothetical protein
MHSWNTFVARMNHEQTRTHKTHHSPDLGETTTLPLIVFFVPGHKANTQMSFCPSQVGVPKFSKLGLLQLWRPITFCANLRLRWGLKQSRSLCQELFNYMWDNTYTQVNQGNFLTFSGHESNWQFDSRLFFLP